MGVRLYASRPVGLDESLPPRKATKRKKRNNIGPLDMVQRDKEDRFRRAIVTMVARYCDNGRIRMDIIGGCPVARRMEAHRCMTFSDAV